MSQRSQRGRTAAAAAAQEQHNALLEALAEDLAVAFGRFAVAFPVLSPQRLTLEAFESFFREGSLGYLHYAGGGGPRSFARPYHPAVVADLLRLCAVYLHLPCDAATRSGHLRAFGLLMCYFLYFTQPQRAGDSSMPPTPIPVSVGVMEGLVEMAESHEEAEAGRVAGGGPSPPPDTLTDAEAVALLALHADRAWQLQPYAEMDEHLAALLRAHDRRDVPLLAAARPTPMYGAGAPGHAYMHGIPGMTANAPPPPAAAAGSSSTRLLDDADFQRRLAVYRRGRSAA